jgi:hypothetical protein
MENTSRGFLSCLQSNTASFVELYEFFTPDETSYIPANAVFRFSKTAYTFQGLAYERKVISRNDISSSDDKQVNSVSIDLVNVNGWLSNLLTTYDLEGYWCQIRLVCPEYPNESFVIFGGTVELPEDVGYRTGSISITQDVYGGESEVPPRTQGAQCPLKFKGRACRGNQPIASKLPIYQTAERCNKSFNQCLAFGNEENYGGFRFVPISGTFGYVIEEVKRFLLFFKKKKRRTVSATFSSVSDAKEDTVIPLIGGVTQIELLPVMHADTGANVKFLSAACDGGEYGIDGIFSVQVKDKAYSPIISNYAFALGKFGSDGQPNSSQFPGAGGFSGTSWVEGSVLGSDPTDANDSAPTISAIVRGLIVDIPNPDDGFAFTARGWSDCGPYLVRYFLRVFGGRKEHLIDDESFLVGGLLTFQPTIDDTGIEQAILPKQLTGGIDFKAYASASGFGAATVDRIALMMAQGKVITGGYGQLVQAYYRYINQEQPTEYISPQRKLRRRYTTNFSIDTKTGLSDILSDMILPSFAGKLVAARDGRTRLKIEAPVPSGFVRNTVIAAGATTLDVDDMTPFVFYRGQVLVGALRPGAEVAQVSATEFDSAANGLTLTCSGTGSLTASSSGATFSGGSAANAATATVTMGGSIAGGEVLTITIDGTSVSYTTQAGDDTTSLAGFMAAMINAHHSLKTFIKAEWSIAQGPVIRLVAKWGKVNFANPLTAPHEFGEEILPITAAYDGSNTKEDTFRWHPGSNLKAINRVSGSYRASVNDWAEAPISRDAEAHQEKTGQVNPYDLNLSAVDNGYQAARLCKIKMGKLFVCRQQFSQTIGRAGIRHEVDDLIVVNFVQGEKTFRNIPVKIENLAIKNDLSVEIKGRIYRSEIFDDTINELTPQILYPLQTGAGNNPDVPPPNPPDPDPPPDQLPDYGYGGLFGY